ncbi:hypothetical protein [Hymenobacter bucti]|uniref:Phage baseplate protein n=1 Tax=Hymenobacter bucti TaxID=1844114 RepID=A0ABW4R1I6_9BACT
MRPLTTIELLNVWEAGLQQTLLEKALHLLRVACAAEDISSIASLSVGQRDAHLLQLREWLFGFHLLNKATCPTCAETVEWETSTRDLRLQTPEAVGLQKEFTLERDGFLVRFRLPNSHDLRRAMSQVSYQATPEQLLADCLISVQQQAQEYSFAELPATIVEALNEQMAREDPQADIQMLVNCPGCGQQWEVRFDIVSYLWLEIESWARHILQEVYALARAYGWSEQDILRMSPQRRQLYLDLIGV